MRMSEAEKRAFILGVVSRNMPVIKSADSDGIIDYIYDTIDARLGLRQYVEEVFGSIFDFCKYVKDNVNWHVALSLNGADGVNDIVSSSIFNFTSKIKDSLGIDDEYGDSLFTTDTDGVTLLSYTGSSDYVKIPDNIKRVSSGAFSGVKYTIRSIDFNNVEFISGGAFLGYPTLTSVSFSGTQRCEIGAECFKDCVQLNCEIPDNIYKFGDRCFKGCSSLTGCLDLMSSVWRLNYIGNRAFAGTGFDTVKIPYLFGQTWDAAFADMPQLSTVELDSWVYELPVEIFSNDWNLQSKGFCTDIVNYGARCFENCGLTGTVSIVNNEGYRVNIGDYAFSGCNYIDTLYIDGCVLNVGAYAFRNCSGVIKLTLGEGIESLGSYCFSGNSKLSYVKIPSTVTGLNDGIFSSCDKLTTIEAPLHLREFEDVLTDGNNASVIYY